MYSDPVTIEIQCKNVPMISIGFEHLTACTSSISTVKSYVVKFIDWNTSARVIGFPIRTAKN